MRLRTRVSRIFRHREQVAVGTAAVLLLCRCCVGAVWCRGLLLLPVLGAGCSVVCTGTVSDQSPEAVLGGARRSVPVPVPGWSWPALQTV